MNKVFTNLDANETAFFLRELTHIKTRTYDVEYPEYKYKQLIPISSEAGPGADTILYRQFDRVGMVKLISNYADDLPRSDVFGKEFSIIVKSVGGSYGYNRQEIKAAQMVGRPLSTRRSEAVIKAYDQYCNTVAWLADGTPEYGGLYGMLFNPNVTKTTPTTGAWATTATADQIIADMSKIYTEMLDLTKAVEMPDTFLITVAAHSRISTIPRSTLSDTTVLEFLQKAYPSITFDWVNELKGVVNTLGKRPSGTTGAVDCAVLYKKSPEKLTFEEPLPFEQFNPQERNLEYVVPAYGRIGGIIAYYPLSISICEGI